MDKLWAPWRMSYIAGIDKKDDGCVFCEKPKQRDDRENLVLFRGGSCFVILNKYPYNNGHLMVVPYRHTDTIAGFGTAAVAELWELAGRCVDILTRAFKAEGFNIGMNLGRIAGAGIDRHVHLHVVPRWNGDVNFMPVLGETKVISQGLLEAYDALAPYFREPGATS